MVNLATPFLPHTAVRRALGRLRRSDPVTRTTGFLAVQGRRAQQRFRGRFVRGVWLHTADYVRRTRQAGQPVEQHVVMPAGHTTIGPPTFLPAETPPLGGPLSVSYGPRTVSLLTRPWIVGRSGAVIAADRRLLWDLSYEWPGHPHRHTAYGLADVAAVELPGVTVTLAAMAADTNYYHFLLNSVARLAYLGPASHLPRADRFLVSGRATPFVTEALALFGVPPDRVVGTDDFPGIRAERLLAPALVEHPFIIPAHLCEFFRHALGLPRLNARRRIFIDRGDAATRRITNLDELRPVLAEFDIELVRLTGWSVARQAALFHAADLVIANHGAALANLVFCQPGTRVLQILAPGMLEREYRAISQHNRLDHDYLVAPFATPADSTLPRKQRDLVVPSSTLRRVLAPHHWL